MAAEKVAQVAAEPARQTRMATRRLPLRVGFTGTREGMTDRQKAGLSAVLGLAGEFHHGDCIGADQEAAILALWWQVRTVSHPPDDPRLRAFAPADEVLPEAGYHERNRAIVDATDLLVAAPGPGAEQLRSGTWSTVRYARRLGRPVLVLDR